MGILEDIGLKEDPKEAKRKREVQRKISIAKDERDDLKEKLDAKDEEIEKLEESI